MLPSFLFKTISSLQLTTAWWCSKWTLTYYTLLHSLYHEDFLLTSFGSQKNGVEVIFDKQWVIALGFSYNRFLTIIDELFVLIPSGISKLHGHVLDWVWLICFGQQSYLEELWVEIHVLKVHNQIGSVKSITLTRFVGLQFRQTLLWDIIVVTMMVKIGSQIHTYYYL